jgi:hypothetical protein
MKAIVGRQITCLLNFIANNNEKNHEILRWEQHFNQSKKDPDVFSKGIKFKNVVFLGHIEVELFVGEKIALNIVKSKVKKVKLSL